MSLKMLVAGGVMVASASGAAAGAARKHCTGLCLEPTEKYGSPRMYGVMEEKKLVSYYYVIAVWCLYKCKLYLLTDFCDDMMCPLSVVAQRGGGRYRRHYHQLWAHRLRGRHGWVLPLRLHRPPLLRLPA
jgi:hypothetical protein